MSYGLSGQLERVVTTTQNGSGTVTGRSRVDYRSNTQGIRTISVDWNDANLDGTFAAGERTGSIEYLIDTANFTGYQQTILEVTKNAAGQATKRISYTFGTDEITQTVSTLNASTGAVTATQTQTFGHDGRGSVQVLFDAAAAIAQVYTYSAYGELLAIHNGSAAVVGTIGQTNLESLAATNKLYNSEGFDTRTGLYNFRARNYSASLGRFERLDPFAGNPTDPFSFNKYGFVHGNPVMGSDPTGLSLVGSFAVTMPSSFANSMDFGRVGVGAETAFLGISTAIIVSYGVAIYGEMIANGVDNAAQYLSLVIANAVSIAVEASKEMARQTTRRLRGNMVAIFPVFQILLPKIYEYRKGPLGIAIPRLLTYMGPETIPGVSAARIRNRNAAFNSFIRRGGVVGPPGTSFDEFPYRSVIEGGALAIGAYVPADENSREGAYLGWFYRIALRSSPGTQFLVLFVP